ncbi:TadE/TadG family type IV pilus assembly protein [Candidatus Leptofilum sp.]|uniref:TadE/TadG family type IV pilus assembly protein n=1 Tax=Candidatus Leptofilum sp. TaxID=3241576 RepID=UPI003B5B41AA
MLKRQSHPQRDPQRGQSLVEVALFFPIFIILLAGLVEVSQLLVTQNRISSAARASTRFSSNGGQDEGMVSVVLSNITQTLETDPNVWDIWSIRATVNDAGTGFDGDGGEWSFTQIYGISNTVRAPSVNEGNIRNRVLNELQRDEFDIQATDSDGVSIAAGLQIVGTYAIHDVDSILGLDAMSQLAGFSSLEALSIMRITADSQDVTKGCTGFPIAVHEEIRSVTAPGTGSNPFPDDFTYPTTNPPQYQSFLPAHTPDVPLLLAQEGDLFRVQNGFGQGNFGWLAWNTAIAASANALNNSLSWPGNSADYTPCAGGNGGCPQGNGVPSSDFDTNVPGYIEAGNPIDTSLQVDDWVSASTGSVNASFVQETIQGHIDLDRELRLLVWDTADPNFEGQGRYHISGFAVFRLLGYQLSQNGGGSWILAEFIRWDDSCGQVAE